LFDILVLLDVHLQPVWLRLCLWDCWSFSGVFWVISVPGEYNDESEYQYADDGDTDWRDNPQRVNSFTSTVSYKHLR